MTDSPHENSLRTFTAYWSAFESLIAAVLDDHKLPNNTNQEKNTQISEKWRKLRSPGDDCPPPTREQIVELNKIVTPSLQTKAAHVFKVLFEDDDAQTNKLIDLCFRRADEKNRLYIVRNWITHGKIDPSNLAELIRVDARVQELWYVMCCMFARIIQFGAPAGNSIQVEAPD